MMTINCHDRKCIFYDLASCECTRTGRISMDELMNTDDEHNPGCFTSYLDTEEYSNKYWVAFEKEKSGEKYRLARRGALIVAEGIRLYTRDRLPPREEWADPRHGIWCTEATTGIGLSLHHVFIPQDREAILKAISISPPVIELPVRSKTRDAEE